MELNNNQKNLIQMNELDNALSGVGVAEDKNSLNTIIDEAKKENISVGGVKEVEAVRPILLISECDRELAVAERLIPEHYKYAKFDEEKIRCNLIEQHKKSKNLYTIYNFDKYISVCNEIISTIRTGRMPRRSWIIGAPNGFGKSSFVNECLILMRKQNWVTAPYISLHELAEIRAEEEKRLMKPFSYKEVQGIYEKDGREYANPSAYYTDYRSPEDIVKKPTIITSAYSWSEYINATCLFVHFTDTVSKDLESHVLYQLLSIRGAKGLPTIVMISTSLEPYIRDTNLKEYVWDEIMDYNASNDSYDRVSHVSCYKAKNMEFNKNMNIEKDTGILR